MLPTRLLTIRHPGLSAYLVLMVWEALSVVTCGLLAPYALNPLLEMYGAEPITLIAGMLIGLFPLSPFFILPLAAGTYAAATWA